MKHKIIGLILLTLSLSGACGRREKGPAVYLPKEASRWETLAAAEVRRYLYLRTGELAPVLKIDSLAGLRDSGIIISGKGALAVEAGDKASLIEKNPTLSSDDYWLKTIRQGKKAHCLIAGGDGPGILYGTYAFIEKLGVRFYLDGDVVPEEKIKFLMPELDETGRPLFKLRGIQPFHDFPEGPDWWNEDGYRAILGQLPKLRMNFFGLHTYPEGGPNAEPTVWIGFPGDYYEDGRVTYSYPSSYQNTLRGNWGYQAKKTGDFHFGASELFERDGYGADIMEGIVPEPKMPDAFNALFNRSAGMLRGAFAFARSLGIKTCVGTETPLTVPAMVKQRYQMMGKNPKDPKMAKDLYKGIFERIRAAYPIDYYWFWTNEGWTWSDATEEAIKTVTSDLDMAIQAAEDAKVPFGLATCGWVLGPPSDRTLFDRVLPKKVAASCINREVGKAPVDPNFARIEGRPLWAIPWLEDDPSLTSPQLWVGRMRQDAVDALKYGCDGLMGIHWRTRILSANALALARAAWDQSWNKMPAIFANLVGPINGQFVVFTAKAIAGLKEESVYRDIRDRVYGYHLEVPNGTYSITLKFLEGEFDKKGARAFDVLVQGIKVAEKVDIFERAGKYKALDLAFRDIKVANGKLAIDFVDRIHYPSIAGLIVEGASEAGQKVIKKINCGGPKVLDYEADWPETARSAASLDFYQDWAGNQFGQAASNEIAGIFAGLDGKLPIPVNWIGGPGGIAPEKRPWAEVRKSYGFVDELAALRPRIRGKGFEERFDYWLKNFEYIREIAHYCCLWADYNGKLEKVKALAQDAEKTRAARETLLPVRREMVNSLKTIFGCLLAMVSNTGELGTIANWEQHLLPDSIEKPGEELQKLLGTEFPEDVRLPAAYEGPARIIVPTVRTSLEVGEHSRLKVIILSEQPPQNASFYWREMGTGDFKAVPLKKIARSVYAVDIPAMMTDLEYYLRARVGEQDIVFPSTAPELNQTIVIFPK